MDKEFSQSQHDNSTYAMTPNAAATVMMMAVKACIRLGKENEVPGYLGIWHRLAAPQMTPLLRIYEIDYVDIKLG